ncbi:MAG: FAD:protein FMN transferase, partial [Clostridia bacterium]|nr:FAD:protein FMN transferase [Clostridia bacterium]
MKRKCRIVSLLLLLLLPLAGCAHQASQDLFCMDTFMQFTLNGRNADAALAACLDEVRALEARFSVTGAASDVSRINAAGGDAVRVDDDTVSLLETAAAVSDMTGGAFDVSVYPLVEAWGFTGAAQQVPDAETIQS